MSCITHDHSSGVRYQLATFAGSEGLMNEQYHLIRKRELFAPVGKARKYDPNHPDEKKDGHFPLLFIADGKAIGTARFDLLQESVIKTAAVRLIAITRKLQGKGHGRVLMEMLEYFAHQHEVQALVLNARQSAYIFYQVVGYRTCYWHDPAEHFDRDSVMMAKIISPRPRGL